MGLSKKFLFLFCGAFLLGIVASDKRPSLDDCIKKCKDKPEERVCASLDKDPASAENPSYIRFRNECEMECREYKKEDMKVCHDKAQAQDTYRYPKEYRRPDHDANCYQKCKDQPEAPEKICGLFLGMSLRYYKKECSLNCNWAEKIDDPGQCAAINARTEN